MSLDAETKIWIEVYVRIVTQNGERLRAEGIAVDAVNDLRAWQKRERDAKDALEAEQQEKEERRVQEFPPYPRGSWRGEAGERVVRLLVGWLGGGRYPDALGFDGEVVIDGDGKVVP